MIDDILDAAAWIADELADLVDDIPTGDQHPTLPPAPGVDPVARALSIENTGKYGFGRGGRRPLWPSPLDALGRSDCSGFALSWVYGLDRYQPGKIAGDWLSCNGVYDDATGPGRMWGLVDVADLQPGHALVWRGKSVNGRRVKIGHTAIVIATPPTVRRFADVTVLHCHGPEGRSPAITRATGRTWDVHNAIAVELLAAPR